jgi:DNA (cytosine-5)-methyltransferase 1
VSKRDSLLEVLSFLNAPRPNGQRPWTAVSLFSGAGLSDVGYELAGFEFKVQVEKDRDRARLGQDNFPHSTWIVGDARRSAARIVAAYKTAATDGLDLLVATPPCQGMSSSNPSRGKRAANSHKVHEQKNKLMLALIPVARALSPKIIVVENVRPILTLTVSHRGCRSRLLDVLKAELTGYEVFAGVVDVASHGVPQTRKRAIVVAVRQDQPFLRRLLQDGLLPWPRPTHAETPEPQRRQQLTVKDWLTLMEYEPLDAKEAEAAKGTHPLHFVPHYARQPDRYLQISQIPRLSGKSAYENSMCPACGVTDVPLGLAMCPRCDGLMRNRPYVRSGRAFRLIRGFGSSYRRMPADRPAATITTNSSHVGSDFKIHPWEHRVLSILEVADLQTVPRCYDWSRALREGHNYLIRNVVGESFPPYFTYLHGKLLDRLLTGAHVPSTEFTPMGS